MNTSTERGLFSLPRKSRSLLSPLSSLLSPLSSLLRPGTLVLRVPGRSIPCVTRKTMWLFSQLTLFSSHFSSSPWWGVVCVDDGWSKHQPHLAGSGWTPGLGEAACAQVKPAITTPFRERYNNNYGGLSEEDTRGHRPNKLWWFIVWSSCTSLENDNAKLWIICHCYRTVFYMDLETYWERIRKEEVWAVMCGPSQLFLPYSLTNILLVE